MTTLSSSARNASAACTIRSSAASCSPRTLHTRGAWKPNTESVTPPFSQHPLTDDGITPRGASANQAQGQQTHPARRPGRDAEGDLLGQRGLHGARAASTAAVGASDATSWVPQSAATRMRVHRSWSRRASSTWSAGSSPGTRKTPSPTSACSAQAWSRAARPPSLSPPATAPHPDLEPTLRDTYGVTIWHEQIIDILVLMTGCDRPWPKYPSGDGRARAATGGRRCGRRGGVLRCPRRQALRCTAGSSPAQGGARRVARPPYREPWPWGTAGCAHTWCSSSRVGS